MPWAVKVYERIRRRQVLELGRDIHPEDYVFMSEAASRDNAMKLLARQFEIVLEVTGLKLSTAGETRTLYSLRHSSIMFRLMFGRTVDTLTLARNARTSPEMIDRFYAAPLQGEMNVGELLQSARKRRSLLLNALLDLIRVLVQHKGESQTLPADSTNRASSQIPCLIFKYVLSKQIAGFINSVCTNGINQYLVTADRIANWSPVAKRYQL